MCYVIDVWKLKVHKYDDLCTVIFHPWLELEDEEGERDEGRESLTFLESTHNHKREGLWAMDMTVNGTVAVLSLCTTFRTKVWEGHFRQTMEAQTVYICVVLPMIVGA